MASRCIGGRRAARRIYRAWRRVSGPGQRTRLVLLGDPPSFDEDDSDPHCCVKPLDAVALPSLAATAACRTRHGPAASCSAPMASRLRCLVTVYGPGCLPGHRDYLKLATTVSASMEDAFSVPSCLADVPEVSRGRRLPCLMSMSPAIGRMAHRVRFAPAARQSSGMAYPCPRGCISRYAIPPYSRIASTAHSAPGRRHPRAMAAAPAPDFHRLPGLPVCRDGSRPRRHRAAPTWPLR